MAYLTRELIATHMDTPTCRAVHTSYKSCAISDNSQTRILHKSQLKHAFLCIRDDLSLSGCIAPSQTLIVYICTVLVIALYVRP